MNTNLDVELIMRPIVKLSVIAGLLFGLTMSASAQQRSTDADRPRIDRQEQMKKMRASHQQQHPHRMMMKLDLSEEQRAHIEDIRLNGQKELLPVRNALREKAAKLRSLTSAESFDQNAVDALIAEIGDLRTERLALQISQRQQVREILTKEQRIKFDLRQRNSIKRQPRYGMK